MLGGVSAFAKETDNISRRYESLEDSTEVLNAEMNRRLQEVVSEANAKKVPCNNSRDIRVLFHELNGASFFIGTLESWAEDNSQVAKKTAKPQESIYQNVLKNGYFFNRLKLASTIKLNGKIVGTDKLGHFIDQGFEFYTPYRTSGYNMKVALSGSGGSEEGYSGSTYTGVQSYADMAANYHGILFFHNLTEGQRPHLICRQGVWSAGKLFSWADYVDESWDEGINCSTIVEGKQREQYVTNIQNLQSQSKRQGREHVFTCPVDLASCAKLQNRYRQYAKQLLSPECLRVNGNFSADKNSSPGASKRKAGQK